MDELTGNTGSSGANGIAAKSPMGKTLAALLISMLVAILACTTTPPMPHRPSGETLSPLMKALRIQSRDLKRALVVQNRSLYPAAAQKLAAAAEDLTALRGPTTFTLHIDALREKANHLAQAAGKSAPQERMDGLFNDLVGACSSCHHIFRK